MFSCEVSEEQSAPEREWRLTWSDEFDGPAGAPPDPASWNFDIGTGQDGWGNQELQYYTDRPTNIAQDGAGHLEITARREAFAGSPFTSARINTQGKFDQAFGRIEARIRTPTGPGLWPAFWMLGSRITEVGWPQAGEIDLMELRGQRPFEIVGSVHGPGYSAGNSVGTTFQLDNDRFDADFHVFAIEWGEDFIEYYVDDFLYQRLTPADVPGEWVFDRPFFLLLNVAVGGTFVGFPTSMTPFPQTMTIDYVRVFAPAAE